ncbi:monofunctional biosynthetic peptidoglycan transglycosylase [Denitrificimonas sp. JX-1]|uniref:Biosynthetic peptidoglycan transglycosylase n=1 Tax=Denitrificimonas halotolerans TaxID=3098930 RepID=A0ABU5GSI2_9GAMM|nr:monofunctional biosynthetic peptidoglycan transglycosylase [Denitrificimonas sp. JX-1]MDY7219754.1 monofunctional biosynthetic peptidoglycan transglycosylase [Denitrificimonas sp. JX-1]
MLSRLLRTVLTTVLSLLVLSVLLVLLLRWVNPPYSALMLERHFSTVKTNESYSSQRIWINWDTLPDNLKIAVIAGEDQQFANHKGFDFAAIRAALSYNQNSNSIRGASTISQQVAKNTFLWSARSWPRKALEAWFTLLIELLWSKERILEVYLNSAEWGHGIFGAEAAAQYHFNTSATHLSNQQAYLLAAILPSPLLRSARQPSATTSKRARWIGQQVRQLGGTNYLKKISAPQN